MFKQFCNSLLHRRHQTGGTIGGKCETSQNIDLMLPQYGGRGPARQGLTPIQVICLHTDRVIDPPHPTSHQPNSPQIPILTDTRSSRLRHPASPQATTREIVRD
jgi:hypothetical protein